jgi:drug/metabolite transporter (DMT)-like permease
MAIALSLLAACALAAGNVLQQKGAVRTTAKEDDPHFLAELLHEPIWMAGGLCQATGWVLQAAALDRGSLVVVQSLCSLNLVISLVLGSWIGDQVVSRTVWAGAAAVTFGIVLVVSAGSPQAGTSTPGAGAWISAVLLAVALVAVLAWAAWHRHGARRALFFGSAAGTCFALQAAVTKAFVPLVGQGLSAVFSSWTMYALIASALAGFALQQSALKTGALAPAVASSNVVTLVGSVVFGIVVYGEKFSEGGNHSVPALVGLAFAIFGIGLLAGAQASTDSGPIVATDEDGS